MKAKFIKKLDKENDHQKKLALFKSILANSKKTKYCHYCKSINGKIKKMP
tara:strand:- start:36 stop:185 length:150 start_codon:yes stop_codon:yes gene_type:complete